MKHLLTINDLTEEELLEIIDKAIDMKEEPEKYFDILKNKTLAMLFQKTSTRTRMSFEAGMSQLSGHAIYMDWGTTNLTLGALQDETKCMARYVDIILARVFSHKDIETIAKASAVPVINGLSDSFHPCQAIADLLTIKEKLGKLKGVKLAYVGDGNNVCNSLILACTKTGIDITVVTPKGYEPKIKKGVKLMNDPKGAVKNADVVYTDTWVSMGQEKEREEKVKDFKGFQVDKKLLGKALFMHCLPAHRGYEVSDDVMDSKQSVVFDQAENRMHAQKAVMLKLMGKI
jgi:ornithine carbamoyltransferase